MTKYSSIGSISHGTLRTEDLLSAFAWELEYLHKTFKVTDHDQWILFRNANDLLAIPEEDRGSVWHLSASDIVSELVEALETFAPPYCYFGTHPGDGSDFGYWPDMDAIDELPNVEGSDEAKDLGEDCKFVNDHGNVTVYGGDGSVLFDLV